MRHLATLALVLGSSSLALADAPGDDEDDGGYYGPSSVEPVVQPAPVVAPVAPVGPSCGSPMAVDVMAHRFAVGLNLGSASFAPEHSPDAKSDFAISELSLRYRATYHLEIELALTGGRQSLEDGSQGELAMGGGTLGLRYRFSPSSRWNWWLMGGIGETTIARHDATRSELDAAARPHGQLGVGIERRFQRFAIQAELRMTAVGDRHDDETMAVPPVKGEPEPAPTNGGGGTTVTPGTPQPIDPTYTMAPEKQSGGQFTIGLSYYF